MEEDQTVDVVTLYTDDGEEMDFEELADIPFEGNLYAVMQPAVLPEDMNEDEAFVFKMTELEDGSFSFQLETDDRIIDAVFEEYNKSLEEG